MLGAGARGLGEGGGAARGSWRFWTQDTTGSGGGSSSGAVDIQWLYSGYTAKVPSTYLPVTDLGKCTSFSA